MIFEGIQAKDGSHRANGRDITFPDGKKIFLGSSGPEGPRLMESRQREHEGVTYMCSFHSTSSPDSDSAALLRLTRLRLCRSRAAAAGEARPDADRGEFLHRHAARLGATEDALGRSGFAGHLADFLRRNGVVAAMRPAFGPRGRRVLLPALRSAQGVSDGGRNLRPCRIGRPKQPDRYKKT